MRLPNNFGTVSKLPGKRRRPWRARKLIRYEITADGKLHEIYHTVGYYVTRAEAIAALAEYNANGSAVTSDLADMTLEQVYSRWSDRKYPTASKSLIEVYRAAWNITPENLAKMPMAKIKLQHLQDAVDKSDRTASMLDRWKLLLGQLYDYAVMYDIVTPDRDKVRYLDLSRAKASNTRPHKRLSAEDVAKLWEMPSDPIRDVTLLLVYSGCRPSELLRLTADEVNIQERFIDIKQSKTAAGIRLVPMAEKTVDLWKVYAHRKGTLFDMDAQTISGNFPIPGHTSYDCRHTCISMLAEAGVDERIIQQIVGHKGQNITRSIYTHIAMEPLLEAINKI